MKRSDDGFALDPAKSRATTQAAQDQRGRSWLTYPPGTPVLVAWGTARPRRAVVLWCGKCADCATIKVQFDDGGEWLAAADKVTNLRVSLKVARELSDALGVLFENIKRRRGNYPGFPDGSPTPGPDTRRGAQG